MSGSVSKSLDLLEAVVSATNPVGLIELADLTGLDKTTASRHLDGLVGRGLVSRDVDTKKYTVGARMMSVAARALQRSTLRSAAMTHLERLRDLTGETASLALRVDAERVCIAGVESHHEVRRVVRLGERVPLVRGAGSIAILATLPGHEAAGLIRRGLSSESDRQRVRQLVLKARRDGYCVADGLRAPEVCAACVAIGHAGHGAVGVILLAGPTQRFSVNRGIDAVPLLREAADELAGATAAW